MCLQGFLHHEVQSSLGQVLGDATPTVSIWDFCVLQVHHPLAHILIEQDSPVMTSVEAHWRLCSTRMGPPCSSAIGWVLCAIARAETGARGSFYLESFTETGCR